LSACSRLRNNNKPPEQGSVHYINMGSVLSAVSARTPFGTRNEPDTAAIEERSKRHVECLRLQCTIIRECCTAFEFKHLVEIYEAMLRLKCIQQVRSVSEHAMQLLHENPGGLAEVFKGLVWSDLKKLEHIMADILDKLCVLKRSIEFYHRCSHARTKRSICGQVHRNILKLNYMCRLHELFAKRLVERLPSSESPI
jgi:hypothetical protein